MSNVPKLKIFNPAGEYIACCKHPEDAAALMDLNGAGSTIRHGHQKKDTVWTEGAEEQPASESYDFVARVVSERIRDRQAKVLVRVFGADSEYTKRKIAELYA